MRKWKQEDDDDSSNSELTHVYRRGWGRYHPYGFCFPLHKIECIRFLTRKFTKCLLCIKHPLHIIISGLTTQRNIGHNAWIREFNARMFEICQKQSWYFINNDNIKDSNLTNDGLHLNMSDVKRLVQNFIHTIRSVEQFGSMDFHQFPVVK